MSEIRSKKHSDVLTYVREHGPAQVNPDCSEPVLRNKGVAKRSRLRDFGRFFLKAFVIMIFLTFLGKLAPYLPVPVLVFAFLAYALPATVGSMFNVVKNRIHRQDLYNESGTLSRYNRRWFIWFAGFFVVYFISAILFVLQAPNWDNSEWLLMWIAVVLYYFVFLFIQYLCKKEYSAKYYKARAIKWSIFIAAAILAVAYTFITSQPATDLHIDLHEIVNGRSMPFRDSPSALLSEADKITTYANQLTEYGLNRITAGSYAVSLIVNLVLGCSAFVGVVSQFGACLLSKRELRSEFQLLPANDGDPEGRVLKRYIALLVALWVALSIAFFALDYVSAQVRATDEYTAANRWIDETTDLVILVAEDGIEKVSEVQESFKQAESFEADFAQRRDSYIEAETEKVKDSIASYYDECAAEVDSYLEWYDSIPGQAARVLPIFGQAIVKDEFVKRVVNPISAMQVQEQYKGFLDGLESLYDEYVNAEERTIINQSANRISAEAMASVNQVSPELDLWVAWDSDLGKEMVKTVLLGQGAGDEPARDRILNYIHDRSNEMQETVESLPGKFFVL